MLERLFDLIAAGLGLVLLSPVLLIVAVWVKLVSEGPIFYSGLRVGKQCRPFHIYKFRTMGPAAAPNGNRITTRNDSRITRVGALLRRTKLDELPQLINVLSGEMSLVGPRPEDPRYVALYTPEQLKVLEARPGITSIASLEFRNEESLLVGADWERIYVDIVMPQKLSLELAYLKRRTFVSDLRVIGQTFLTILRDCTNRKTQL